MVTAVQRHIAAIQSGNVTKTNVIGLRKALNHIARLEEGWSGNRSNATPEEVAEAVAALAAREPLVRGDLHASGVRIVTSPRWWRRFNQRQHEVIRTLHGFRLVRFDYVDSTHVTPVFRAVGETGDFLFRNVPWQTVAFGGEGESGPQVVN